MITRSSQARFAGPVGCHLGQLPAGATVTRAAVLFPRLEEAKKD
ncbi:hypothetical protein ACPCSC_18875 [Streptomyces lavendulocolor]